MAYKIVVDAGHGGCQKRSHEEAPTDDEQKTNRERNDTKTCVVFEETGRGGRKSRVSYTVEREFLSEASPADVLARVVKLLLETPEETSGQDQTK